MKCPKCKTQNPGENKFCRECGIKLLMACPQCAAEVLSDDKFCGKCGHELGKLKETPAIDYNQPQSYTPKFLAEKILTTRSSMEGERKLVTVLFADVANYTAIAEKLDPEDVHQVMDGCFRILMDEIHRYEGTINQFAGDGVMALFGAPVAHEDHALRACHAAFAIQRSLEKYREGLKEKFGFDFRMRVGLNSGPVVVGTIGDDLRMDYTAFGDTTNLAARMESMARPGTILVSTHSHKLVKDSFEFKPLGKLQVKGKAELQEAYELIEPSEVETRIGAAVAKGLTKFVGRKREIDALKEAFDKTQSGSGQVVGIVGEPGVGKSRLLLELRNVLPMQEYTYFEGRCLHYGGSMPYLPILDILKPYLDIRKGDRELIIKKKMEGKILQLDKSLNSVFPPIQELLSLEVEDQSYMRLEPREKKVRTFEALRDLFVRESENKPLVLAVEDLHWIDRTSNEFLDFLIGWLANTRILLILLYRPEYAHQWGSKSHYREIGVDQLAPESSAELVQAILEEAEVVPEVKELILGRAGGNPLFVEEVTASLLENGFVESKDHQYVLTRKASEIQVPDTLQGIIAARIDRLGEDLKRTVQAASVIGREFALRILQTIMGKEEELESHLLKLQGLEFIYEKRPFPELEYMFKHALTQEVAYNSLLRTRRKEIHEKVGEAIESLYLENLEEYYELLAYHYRRSDDKDKAVEYLDLADQKAIKVSAMEEAMSYFYEAMNLLDTLPENEVNKQRRISLLANQWPAMLLLFKFSEYKDLLTRYEPMVVELGKQGLLGTFFNRKGHCDWWFGRLDQAIQNRTKALELCEAAGIVEGVGQAYSGLQWSYLYKGDYDKVFPLKEDILRIMEQQFNPREYVTAVLGASWAYTELGRWDEAVQEGLEALRVAEEYSDNSLISFAALFISRAYTWKGNLARGIEYGQLAAQKAPTPADKAWAQSVLARALCVSGEPSQGIEIMAVLVPMIRAVGYDPGAVQAMAVLGEGYWLAGDYDKARKTLEECLNLAERCGMKFYIGWAHCLLGETFLEVDRARAPSHFEKSIAIFQEHRAEHCLALAYAGYGRFYRRQGQIAPTKEYLKKAMEIFERIGTLIEPDKVREELAELPERG